MKYLTTTTHTSDTSIDILNSQVEYRKNLFMFVIVLFEFISSILIISSSIQAGEISISRYFYLQKHDGTNRTILIIIKTHPNSMYHHKSFQWMLNME